jgi:hypothetical protein
MIVWPLTFLNASLLLGTTAVLVPLIIHLLNRTQYRRLDWGAMLFLDQLERIQTRSWDWRSWLLLLLRCAIPLCLALCMARPYLAGSFAGGLLGHSRAKSTHLIVDNSLSMLATAHDPKVPTASRIDCITSELAQWIRQSDDASRWSITPLLPEVSDESAEGAAQGRYPAIGRLKKMTAGADGGSVIQALHRELEHIRREQPGEPQLILASDFQKSFCSTITPEETDNFRQVLATLPNPPRIVLWALPRSSDSTNKSANITVRIASDTPSVVAVGQPCYLRVMLRNFGGQASEELKLTLTIDGRPMTSRQVSLPAGAERQSVFSLTFPEAGSHRIEAQIEAEDVLGEDNIATFAILALREIPVLMVDDSIASAMPAVSDYLQTALAPFLPKDQSAINPFRVVRFSSEQLNSSRLAEAKVVIIAQASQWSDDVVRQVIDHTEDGGVTLIFAGPTLDAAWYNQHLGTFLGLEFADQARLIPPANEGIRLQRETFQHPALRILHELGGSSLESLEFRGWFPTSVRPGLENPPTRCLSLTNGDALLWERSVGQGSLLVCTTSCDPAWSNWPLRPSYLPVMQRWITAATPANRWVANLTAGQSLAWPPPQLRDWLADTAATDDSEPWQVRWLGDRGRVEDRVLSAAGSDPAFPRTLAVYPGFYRLEGWMAEASGNPGLYAAAQASLAESELSILEDASLENLAEQLGGQVVRSIADYTSLADDAGQEIWRWVLGLLLILLFGELLLQRSFLRASP